MEAGQYYGRKQGENARFGRNWGETGRYGRNVAEARVVGNRAAWVENGAENGAV